MAIQHRCDRAARRRAEESNRQTPGPIRQGSAVRSASYRGFRMERHAQWRAGRRRWLAPSATRYGEDRTDGIEWRHMAGPAHRAGGLGEAVDQAALRHVVGRNAVRV